MLQTEERQIVQNMAVSVGTLMLVAVLLIIASNLLA